MVELYTESEIFIGIEPRGIIQGYSDVSFVKSFDWNYYPQKTWIFPPRASRAY